MLEGAIRAAPTATTEWFPYIAPTYKMAKRIAWEELQRLTPRRLIQKENEGALAIKLINGKWIALFGADNPDSLRGINIRRFVADEYDDMEPRVFPEIIRPTLATTGGDGLFIGTPKGYKQLHELYLRGQNPNDPQWVSWQTTTLEGGLVPQSEIDAARLVMTEKQFRQEFEASFETVTARVFHAFDRKIHVRSDLVLDPDLPVLIGIDFNVNPGMHAVIAHKVADQLHILDEIFIPDGNTEEVSREVVRRYGIVRTPTSMSKRQLYAYPDPTGRRRQTSAPTGHTDFTILNSFGITVRAPHAPYPVEDKINTSNAALKTASGHVRTFIHPRCERLIKGLEGLTYKGDTIQPDKSSGLDHITDAWAYLTCFEIPMRKNVIVGKGPF